MHDGFQRLVQRTFHHVRRFSHNQSGAAVTEYACILGVIAITLFTAMSLFGEKVTDSSHSVTSELTVAVNGLALTSTSKPSDDKAGQGPLQQPAKRQEPRKKTRFASPESPALARKPLATRNPEPPTKPFLRSQSNATMRLHVSDLSEKLGRYFKTTEAQHGTGEIHASNVHEDDSDGNRGGSRSPGDPGSDRQSG